MGRFVKLSVCIIAISLLTAAITGCAVNNTKVEYTSTPEEEQPQIIKRTFLEAFDQLKAKFKEVKDMRIWMYGSQHVNREGKSSYYQILGFSMAQKAEFFIEQRDAEIDFHKHDFISINEINYFMELENLDLSADKFRDSPEMVQEVIDIYNKWDDKNAIVSIDIGKPMAEVGIFWEKTDIGKNEVSYLK